MSNGKDSRLLVIAEQSASGKLAEMELFRQAQALALHPQVEWLIFYTGNMGIITEEYQGRLLNGYPLLSFGLTKEPFRDKVSQELFRDFFERYVYAKGIGRILTTTCSGLKMLLNFSAKRQLKLMLYQSQPTEGTLAKLPRTKDIEIFCLNESEIENALRKRANKIGSFSSLLETFIGKP